MYFIMKGLQTYMILQYNFKKIISEILDENTAKTESKIQEINHRKSTKNEVNAPKRKCKSLPNSSNFYFNDFIFYRH